MYFKKKELLESCVEPSICGWLSWSIGVVTLTEVGAVGCFLNNGMP